MSLLLEALKRNGEPQHGAAPGSPAATPPGIATRKPRSAAAPQLTLETLPETSRKEAAREIEDDLARMSGHNLFVAKSAPAGPRLAIIPIALIIGCLLAAGGGYYVWRETSPRPFAQAPIPPVASATGAIAASPAVPALAPVEPEPKAAPAMPAAKPVSDRKPETAKPAQAILAGNTPAAAPKAQQPISIERGKAVAKIDPGLLAGYQAYREGDLDAARQHYGEVLGKDANNRDALLGLAAIAQQQSQDATAAQYYRQVLTLDPRNPVAHAGMSALIDAIDNAGTESRLKQLLAQQPHSAALYFALGNHYAEQLRWSEAQQAYFEAARLAPDDGQVVFNLAVSLDHLSQSKLAAQYYQRALQLSPADAAGFNRVQVQQRINELIAP